MKKLFVSLVALVAATMSYAQNTLVATLSHGDDISIFYGSFAFRDALDAAEDGDLINLSGGSFYGCDITKAVTIRGAGAKSNNPTFITRSITISIPSHVSEKISFEGCIIPDGITTEGILSNASFVKDEIRYVSLSDTTTNATFINCNLYGITLYGKSTTQFVNSYVEAFYNTDANNCFAYFLNCYVCTNSRLYGSWRSASDVGGSSLVNCLIEGYYAVNLLPASSSAFYCVAYRRPGEDYNIFRNLSSIGNCSYATTDDISEERWGDLTDEAKEKYLGTDGTPVGMYGGPFPYNMTPTYPQITKMNVANKTTADGKLSVEIEVSATE